MNARTMVYLLMFMAGTAHLTVAQETSDIVSKASNDEPSIPTIVNKTSEMKKFDGFFNLYWEDQKEKLWLEINLWDQDFLYVTSTPANVSGSDRGSWSGTQLRRFTRQGSKVFLVNPNHRYRAISDDASERQAVADAYNPTITHGFKVAAEEDGRVLIDATSFFLSAGSGAIDKSRSAFYWKRTKNFPKNTEVEVIITAKSGNSGAGQSSGRGRRGGDGSKTTRRHHSLVELPDSNYVPRRHDHRINVNSTRYMDYATHFSRPIHQRLINRHRLVKRNPNAPISEPINPIVYYVDPGAPEPIRSALVEGASWWNEAFEEIGFKNAFRVEVLPADADPMDLRYNMILWIHRPERSWSSGHQVTDPRTGEIICGRVFLGSQRMRQDFLIGSGLRAMYHDNIPDTATVEKMVLARVRQLSAHEVGHTLGYAHNFAASTFGRASVMDYPHPTITSKPNGTLDMSDTYDIGIGEWDKVAIAYSYTQFPAGTDEKKALDAIIDAAHKRGMFWSQTVGPSSASPLTHQWDNGQDAFAEFENVMRVRSIALRNFSEANIPVGQQLSTLEEVLVPIYLYHRYQVEAVSKSLGGLDYRFNARGDGQKMPVVVSAQRQRKALDLLLSTLEPKVLAVPDHITKLIPPRSGRGGETFPRHTSPGFDPLAAAETAADHTLTFLLNPNRAARLIQQHAANPEIPSFDHVLAQLLSRTWLQTLEANTNVEVARAVDSIVLQKLMGLAINKNATAQVRAKTHMTLVDLKSMVARSNFVDKAKRAHFLYAHHLIEQFLKDPDGFELPTAPEIPAGAPIGMQQFPASGIICNWNE